jgi:hypothetical protein
MASSYWLHLRLGNQNHCMLHLVRALLQTPGDYHSNFKNEEAGDQKV